MKKKYKEFFLIVMILASVGLVRYLSNFEDMLGLQFRGPDMDVYEEHDELIYYTSYEKGFFTYNPKTKEITKLSNDKAATIYFHNGYVFIKKYRGSSIIRMDEDGQNRKVILDKNCYKYRVYGQKVYFIHYEDRKLYSINLDGAELQVEYDSTFKGLRIENNYLYLIGKNNQLDLKIYFDNGRVENVIED